MKRVIALITSMPLMLTVAPPAAASTLTNAQATELCRPQLDSFVQFEISEHQKGIAVSQRDATENPDLKESAAEEIRAHEKHISELRSKGIGAAETQAMINDLLRELPSVGKAKIRKGITEAKTNSDPSSVAAACLMEAVLAKMEGRSQ